MKKILITAAVLQIFAVTNLAQTLSKSVPAKNEKTDAAKSSSVKNSPAYAEILLRKTELEATVEDLLVEYTEEYPKLKESRYELSVLNNRMTKILAVNPSEAGKLTQALGKLILRHAELETDLHFLLQRFGDEHPDVKRAKRKVAVFDKAIKEILP